MPTAWEEIEQLRKAARDAQSAEDRARPGTTTRIDDDPRIASLLDRLAAEGDLDAAVQRSLSAISRLYYDGQIHRCEAFARAMQSIAAIVERKYGRDPFDASTFLSLAWGYLCADSFQNFFDHLGPVRSTVLTHSRSHGYDRLTSGGHWTNDHSSVEGAAGTGWMQPLPEDLANPSMAAGTLGPITVADQARSGKHDHFLANAVANYWSKKNAVTDVGGTISWVLMQGSEESKTDQQMNSLGRDFGAFLHGKFIPAPPDNRLSPDTIADWIRKHLCTEIVKTMLYWQSKDQVNYPNDELASYHHYEFRVAAFGFPERRTVTWKAWVRIPEGHSHTVWSGMRSIELNLGACDTEAALIAEAQKQSGLEFKAPPG